MTKQDEIKTGLSSIKLSKISYDGKVNYPHFLSPIDIKNILSYLHSQGVVLRVDRELPDEFRAYAYSKESGYIRLTEYLKEAGFEAVEPLIKEE